jgi:hypothetical protein
MFSFSLRPIIAWGRYILSVVFVDRIVFDLLFLLCQVCGVSCLDARRLLCQPD